jgi:predicted enzyme related to lactoylglutathione lyase
LKIKEGNFCGLNNIYMQTNILGLRTTIYHVGDIKQATEWYSKAFNTEPYFNEPFYVGFNIASFELGLQPEENPTTNKVESVVSYWGVNSIETEYQRLIALGATEHQSPQNVGGEIIVASVKDQWGNIIGLIYNPEFKG